MAYLPDIIDWQTIAAADLWLDRDVSARYQAGDGLAQDWARVGKVIEELGETIAALIGYTGQNPRKGVTHDRADMLAELGDTVMTGILAIQHFTKDTSTTRHVIREAIRKLEGRIPAPAVSDPLIKRL